MIPTREQLEEGRHQGYRMYGYKKSFCDQNRSCEECERVIRFWCMMIVRIEKIQEKRILRLCKQEGQK